LRRAVAAYNGKNWKKIGARAGEFGSARRMRGAARDAPRGVDLD